MIDWFFVGVNGLWILGCSIVLAAFSYHDWLAGGTGRRRRDLFRDPSWRVSFAGGMLLVCAGFGLGRDVVWWQRAIWALLGLSSLRVYSGPATRIIAGAAASILLLWLAGRGVDWSAVGRTLAAARWLYVALGALAALLATGARAWRWAGLLDTGGGGAQGIGWIARLWRIVLIGQTINIAIPARLGEVSRVLLAAEAARCTKTHVIASIALEKLLDSVVFVAILGLATLALPLPPWLAQARNIFAVLTVLGFLGTVLLALRSDWLLALIDRVSSRGTLLARTGFGARLRPALDALQVMVDPAALIRLLAISTLVWAGAAYANYLVLQALAIEAPVSASLLLLAVLQLGTAPPSTPGKVGVFQYLCIIGLMPFGVGRELALSYGLLLHAVVYIPPVAIGSLLMSAEVPRFYART